MSIYRRLTLTNRIHYTLYWLLVGLLIFIQQELIVRLTGETDLAALRFLISIYISLAAIFTINMEDIFSRVIRNLVEIIDFPIEYDRWTNDRVIVATTLKSKSAKASVLALMIGFTATVIWLGLPYESTVANINFIITLQPFLIASALMIFSVLSLLYYLRELVGYPLKAPFFWSKHPAVMLLANCYSRASAYALVIVLWLALSVTQNPYGFHAALLFWWLFTAIIPLFTFLWSSAKIHEIMRNIKQESVRTINQQLQDSFEASRRGPSLEQIEKQTGLMTMQNLAEKMPEWPISTQGIATFLATLFYAVLSFGATILVDYGPELIIR